MSWETRSQCFFSWNFIWFGQKETINIHNFRFLTAHVKCHRICTLISFFYWKYIKCQLKKYRGVIVKRDAEFEEKPPCCFRNEKHLVDLIQAHKGLKNLYFDWSLLFKVYNVWPKNAQRCYLWKIQKMDTRFGKWHEEYGTFSPEQFKSVETRTLKGSFRPEWKMHALKITEELCVMTLKNDEKFERKLTCEVKSDMKNLTNFGHWTWESQTFAL